MSQTSFLVTTSVTNGASWHCAWCGHHVVYQAGDEPYLVVCQACVSLQQYLSVTVPVSDLPHE